jgi:hypothetical protein
MISKIKNWWPALFCILAYYVIVASAIYISSRTTSGRLIYPLDDTYIHMSIAKNFAEHGVWGFTRYSFSSSTSSPLYTAILAGGYFIIGNNEWMPLAFNLIFGTIFIVYIFIFLRETASHVIVFLFLLFIIFVTSIPALTLLGMEHLLHAVLTFGFVSLGATALAGQGCRSRSNTMMLLLLAVLLPLARYEGCFAVAAVSGFLFLQKRYRLAIGIALAGALPLLIYGYICHLQHWLFLPNSVYLKGNRFNFSSLSSILDALGLYAVSTMSHQPVLILLFILALMTCLYSERKSTSDGMNKTWWMSVIFLCIMFAHLQTASLGWLYRYESYLVSVGLTITLSTYWQLISSSSPERKPSGLLRVPFLVPLVGLTVLSFPFVNRGAKALAYTTMAMNDRYLEHIQPARFLSKYYPKAKVVINDIGIAAYFTDCRLFDIYGLGNMEPVRYRASTTGYKKKEVAEWIASENAEIALLQIHWSEVSDRIPDSWVKVAEWRIPRNVVFNDLDIGWYAINNEAVNTLASDLRAFRSSLPKDITVKMMINPPDKNSAQDADSDLMIDKGFSAVKK